MNNRTAIRSIITITLNPALDVSTSAPAVTPDDKLRCADPLQEPGGGGINVARVAGRLGCPATAVAVAGGPTGDRLVALLRAEGVEVVAIDGGGDTRESFSVEDRSTGRQYRFVLPGPPLSADSLVAVEAAIEDQVDGRSRDRGPVVVLSGSVPPGLEAGAFTGMVDRLSALDGVDVIVDTSGDALRQSLDSRARLIKPSARELAALVGSELDTEAEIQRSAEDLVARHPVGAVLASIGAGGAVLASADRPTVRLMAPTVQVRSTVGAGDSLVGGLAVGLARGLELPDAAALGVAAGTAAVMTAGSGLCQPPVVERLRPLVHTIR